MAVVDNSDLNHGHYEWVACVVFCAITPVFLFLRFYSRLESKQLGSDDWAALGAWMFAFSCNLQTILAINHGWGRHLANLKPDQVTITLLLHWSFQITYKPTVALNKISILLLYLRIMPQRAYRMTVYILLALVSLFCLATTVAGVFQCVPVAKAWHKSMKGHCYNLKDAWYTNAVFSIVTDFVILFLPMHMVYKLQRDKREKVLLYFIFGIGGFVTFTSIMRFFALKDANSKDSTYDVNSGFWSVIEINIGVICICLPPMRALLSRHLHFLISNRSGMDDADRPYPLGYVKTDPNSSKSSEPKLVHLPDGQGRRTMYPEESEEELVHGSNERGHGRQESGIMKTMQFSVTEQERTGTATKQEEKNMPEEVTDWQRRMR